MGNQKLFFDENFIKILPSSAACFKEFKFSPPQMRYGPEKWAELDVNAHRRITRSENLIN